MWEKYHTYSHEYIPRYHHVSLMMHHIDDAKEW